MQTNGHALYEPKLVELWEKRYHDFEADEAVRRLSEAKAKMRPPQEQPNPKVA
jgi:hypothetical protein